MPVCTIFLLSLDTSIPPFISKLRESSLQPLITAQVVRWIITPTTLSKHSLITPTYPWDLMLILPNSVTSLPAGIQPMIHQSWSIQAGIPSKLLQNFPTRNARLLHPPLGDIPPLTGPLSQSRVVESAQALELSRELREWITSGKGPQGAVSMLNLLAFLPGKKEEYLKYGQAFAESVGSRIGGVAKIVGKVVPGSCSDGCGGWEEVSYFFLTIGQAMGIGTRE